MHTEKRYCLTCLEVRDFWFERVSRDLVRWHCCECEPKLSYDESPTQKGNAGRTSPRGGKSWVQARLI